jgi:hypothetical protein
MNNYIHKNQHTQNNIQNDIQGDIITSLPYNSTNIQPTLNELKILDTLFKEHRRDLSLIFNEFKHLFIIALIFVILNTPYTDYLIKKLFPITNNSIYLYLLIKTLLFLILYWTYKNFLLYRK